MKKLLKEALSGNFESKRLITEEGKKNVEELLDNIKSLSDEELVKLGNELKDFPFGCNLTEILVDVAGTNQSIEEIKGAVRIVNRLGFPVHVCSYAIGDIAEREGKTPVEILKEIRNLTDLPIDADHFGKFGPMRYPDYISKCPAYCYKEGKGFDGCPRGRIYKRLLDKEKLYQGEKEKWAELVQSISVSLMSFQKNTSHSASKDETSEVVEFAKSRKRGVGGIIAVGNGEDELIKGLKSAIELRIDEIVIEGGPYNKAKNRKRAFGEAVVAARIVSQGKIVATNGQYEDELRFGLNCGLNSVISGFPGNHHAYMSGYKREEISKEKFGLPKVLEIMAQEVKDSPFPSPADREVVKVIAASAKFLGCDYIYPNFKIGSIPLGDAHWFLLLLSPISKKIKLKYTLQELKERLIEKRVKKLGVIGARFISWGIIHTLKETVEEFHISDKNLKVEEATQKVFTPSGVKIVRHFGNDRTCIESSEITVVASFLPKVCRKFKNESKVLTLTD